MSAGRRTSYTVRWDKREIMGMKDITIAVETPGGAEAEGEWRGRRLREVAADFDARGVGLRMANNLPREELYDRSAW